MTINTKSRAAAFAVALTMSLSACGSSTGATTTTLDPGSTSLPPVTTVPETTTTPEPTTSPEPTTTITSPASEEATATLESIRSAAADGDLQQLAELALSFDTTFTASFGQTFNDAGDLAAFWGAIEDPTVPEVVLGLLDAGYTKTLANNEDGTQVGINVTPAVMGEGSTDADRERLEAIFGEDTVAGWYADGMYLGWRLGVDDDGVWRFLVIGD